MRRIDQLAFIAVAAFASAVSSVAHADPFTVTYEAPGVQNSTGTFSYAGVETFDEQPQGANQSFTTSYGTSAASPYQMSGTYSGVQVNAADQYGGAGGTGNYATTFSSTGYSLNVSATNSATGASAPINYFGFWLSALDSGNQVTFYNGATQVYSFSPAQVQALLVNQSGYLGNPNANFKGNNAGQPYVFLNFYDTLGSFNRIVFSESPANGGYESDNQTVGYFTSQSGTNVVPEPASFGLVGLGAVGLLALRRHRRSSGVSA